jgi:hypothetical protein
VAEGVEHPDRDELADGGRGAVVADDRAVEVALGEVLGRVDAEADEQADGSVARLAHLGVRVETVVECEPGHQCFSRSS